MQGYSNRLILIGFCAWMSVCLLLAGWVPSLEQELRFVWLISGMAGLVSSVGLAEAAKQDKLHREQVLRESMRAACLDNLTGLGNRQAFQEALETAVDRAEATEEPLSLLLIDVDHMEDINVLTGMAAGDQLLIWVARQTREYFDGKGAVARHDGDEFAVALPNLDLHQAFQLASRFRVTVHEASCEEDLLPLPVTVSIGVAEVDREERFDQLIHRAGHALQIAKRMGRDVVWFAHLEPELAEDSSIPMLNPTSGADA